LKTPAGRSILEMMEFFKKAKGYAPNNVSLILLRLGRLCLPLVRLLLMLLRLLLPRILILRWRRFLPASIELADLLL
jgi:hypothetical protein